MNATLTRKQVEEKEREEAKDFLRLVFDKQDKPKAYTSLKWVSSSGMSRDMKVLTVHEGEILDLTWWLGKLDIGTIKERNGQRVLRVNGCGMDMGFHVVYSLSAVLYGHDDRGAYKIEQAWL